MRLFAFTVFLLTLASPGRAFWIDPEWTVLAYLDAEGTLEGSTLDNLMQMMNVGSTPRVNLVVLVDRPGEESRASATPPVPDWRGARLMKVERGGLEVLEDWGPTNMAAPATLERFLRTAAARFPARRYLLVIGDHGLGWSGVCQDEDGRDQLTLPELSGALTHCKGALAGKLEVIGMDACLMATAEVAMELATHAKILVASEEAAPTDGWRYDRLLEELDAHPGIKAAELGRMIVDTYRKQFDAKQEDRELRAALGITLSVIDLSKMAAVERALDEVAQEALVVLNGWSGFETLAKARSSCAAFGAGERTDSGQELFDLCDLAEQLRGDPVTARKELRDAVERLDHATRAAVIHNMSGRARADAKGLSVFWPETAQRLEDEDARYRDLALAVRTRWGTFLKAFGEQKDARTTAVKVADVKLSGTSASRAHPVTLSARLADGEPEASWIGLWAGPPAGLLLASRPMELSTTDAATEAFDGRWLMVTEGRGGFPADVADFEAVDGGPDESMMNLSAQHCRRGASRWDDVSLHFYLDNSQADPRGELAFVVSRRPGAPDILHVQSGDRLRPIHWSIEANGKVKRHDAPAECELVVREPRNLGLRMARLKPGRYGVGVVTRDAADRWLGTPLPLTVR